MKQYSKIFDAIIEDSDTKVQDLAKVIGVSTKQIRRWRDRHQRNGHREAGEAVPVLSRQRDYILGLPRDLDWPRG